MKEKRKSKLLLCSLLIVIGLVSTILYVSASEKTVFSISSHDNLKRGDTVTFAVSGKDVEDFDGLYLDVDYDTDSLEYQSSSFKEEYGDYSAINLLEDGKLNLVIVGFTDNRISMPDGEFAYFTFKVKDNASGNYDIKLSVHNGTDYFIREDIEQVPLKSTCEDGNYFVNVPVTNVSLLKDEFTLVKGETDNITINYEPLDTTTAKNYRFTSNDEKIVTVDDDGVIEAVGNGSTTIDVSAFGESFSVSVNVYTPIEEVKFTDDRNIIEIEKGETLTNVATVLPSDTTEDKTINYSSSKNEVATVDQKGEVTAIAPGNATITATASNGMTATYEVNVVIKMTDFELETTNFNLNKGASVSLKPIFKPTDTTDDKAITWESSDSDVVSVTADGLITGLKAGKDITITGTLKNGMKVTATVNVIVPIEGIELDKDYIELLPNQSEILNLTINPSDTTDDKTITWSVEDDKVVKVESGRVTALTPGTTTVTATVGNFSKSATVKVLTPIDSVYPSESEVTMNKGDKHKLSVIVYPENAEEDKSVTWESKNNNIVTVNTDGELTAVGKGTTTVVGTLKNGKQVEVKVTVLIPLTDIELNTGNFTLNKGDSKEIIASLLPSDTTETSQIEWISSNNDVASVSNGVVTAKKAGSTIITARIGNISKSITVTVEVPVEAIELNEDYISLNRGDSFELIGTVKPDDATINKDITYESSNEKVATVSSTGLITAIGSGDAIITAKAGEVEATMTVHVDVPITSFTILDDNIEIIRGKTYLLKTEINPIDTSENTTINWISTDNSIATVNKDGLVTAIKGGNVTITGTLENGMKVSANVTVKTIDVSNLSFASDELDINIGKTSSQKLIINPIDATELDNLVWSSSDPSVATVDNNGNVKAISKGSAIIKASIGNIEASYTVNVIEIPLKEIIIENTISKLQVGDKYQIFISKNPTNTTDEVTINYYSSNPDVLTVDENGLVTAIKSGKATIYVETSNGISTSMEINVTEKNTAAIESNPETSVDSVIPYIVTMIISVVGVGVTLSKKIKN